MSDLQGSLSERLRDRIKKATSNVATKIEAEKGHFKVIVSENTIDAFYKGFPVGTIKVANMSPEEIEHINQNPQVFAQEALETVMGMDEQTLAEIEKMHTKTAANAALDEQTAQMITQKQLDDQKVKLHPRTDEFPTKVTQKQLPEAGQRPGTYDVTTEAQLKDERKTFYGEDRTAGDWKDENRQSITESQFDDGTKTFSDVGTSDREEMGAKFDGGPEKQALMTGEKQLAELLKHHEWKEPATTTESQLKEQKGELGRITAAAAMQIIKESLQSMGNTVLAAGITPDSLAKVVKDLVSHPSKYPVLAGVIMNYANSDVSAINQKVAKSRYFGKTANINNTWSDLLIADVLVRQLAKSASDPRHIVQALVSLAETEDFSTRIHEASEASLTDTNSVKEADTMSVFKEVLANADKPKVTGDDSDGLYEYNGAISEVKASLSNRSEFVKAAEAHARKEIGKVVTSSSPLEADKIDVDEDNGTFSILFKNPAKAQSEALEVRAAKRRGLIKEAQVPGGGMAPPAGGAGAGAGANPMVPPGGADMNAPPPTESLSQPLPEPGAEEEAGGGEPKPPGSICGICGSEDVDIDSGKINCNNCGAKGSISFKTEWENVPGVLEDTKDKNDADEGFGLGDGLGSEEAGGENPEDSGTTLPNVPVAASVRLTPMLIEKIAQQKIEIGKVCPNCGSHKTDLEKAKTGKAGICWDCLAEYNFVVKANKNKKHEVYAEWKWTPIQKESCTSCSRLKTAFVNSLKNYGMTWNQFHGLGSMKQQAEVVLKMAKAGVLNIKEAAADNDSIVKYAASSRWDGYQKFDAFPDATCRERLNRRFGENATAMSGPCKGDKLADCVCKQLDSMGIYTDGLAAKVASRLASTNPMINNPTETCIHMFVREGYNINDSCTVCDALRAAYASDEDIVVEKIAAMGAPMGAPAPAAAPPMAPKAPMAPNMKPKAPMAPKMGPATAPSAKPMEGNPIDEPVSDLPDDIGFGGDDGLDANNVEAPLDNNIGEEVGGIGGNEMGEELGGNEMGEELGGNEMGEELAPDMGAPQDPAEMMNIVVDGLQDIINALQGNFQPEEEFGNGMGGGHGMGMQEESPIDVSNITENTVGVPHDESLETPAEEAAESEEVQDQEQDMGIEEHAPEGAFHDEASETPEEEAAESEEVQEQEEEAGSEEHVPGVPEDLEENEPLEKESKPEFKKHDEGEEKEAQRLEKMLYAMKNKTIKKHADAFDDLYDNLMRQAMKCAAKDNDDVKKVEYKDAKEKKVTVKPTQDATEIGKYKDGGKLGAEDPFTKGVKDKPDVPRGKATLGDEGDEVTVNEEDRPSVPAGGDKMEGEENFKAEKTVVVDGNQGGQKAASKK
jgi:hypothetical protein